MTLIRTEKHQFALYYEPINLIGLGVSFELLDSELIARIVSVLRLQKDETVILFNRSVQVTCLITNIAKKNITCSVISSSKTTSIKPEIIVLLPLLKREALESAIYFATVLGITTIQLVVTEKSGTWKGDKELERLERIVIAAAEQSKQFSLPTINKPCSLENAVERYVSIRYKIHADVDGDQIGSYIAQYDKVSSWLISVGPEGDLVQQERDYLKTKQFYFTRLTPSVLKSEQACMVLWGIIRSFT